MLQGLSRPGKAQRRMTIEDAAVAARLQGVSVEEVVRKFMDTNPVIEERAQRLVSEAADIPVGKEEEYDEFEEEDEEEEDMNLEDDTWADNVGARPTRTEDTDRLREEMASEIAILQMRLDRLDTVTDQLSAVSTQNEFRVVPRGRCTVQEFREAVAKLVPMLKSGVGDSLTKIARTGRAVIVTLRDVYTLAAGRAALRILSCMGRRSFLLWAEF